LALKISIGSGWRELGNGSLVFYGWRDVAEMRVECWGGWTRRVKVWKGEEESNWISICLYFKIVEVCVQTHFKF
jgi:hypothetical protein